MNNSEHTEALRVNRKLESLTSAARKAHAAYRTAKYKNLRPIQSPAEVKANARYVVRRDELTAFCREHGIRTPKTW